MHAVAYLRVSTDDQAESGAGLLAQRDAIRAHADRQGWPVASEHADEGVSGAAGLERRPALLAAIAALGPGDVLLVAKRDRLARDPIVCAMAEAAVQRAGARVVSAAGEGTEGDDPTSVLMRRIVDSFAEYERLVIRARTRAALASKRRRGERTGKVRFGQALAADGVHLVDAPEELATAGLIRDLRAGGLSYRAIARELDRRGIRTKEGRPRWVHTSVRQIASRPALAFAPETEAAS